jgi:N-acetylneuraminic acid mutarotase
MAPTDAAQTDAALRRAGESWGVLPPSNLTGRSGHIAVWTGTEMIIWGGLAGVSARLCDVRAPCVDPEACGVWCADGGRYDPNGQTWSPLSASPLAARSNHVGVWTGTDLILWGGTGRHSGQFTLWADGARYDPAADRWTSMAVGPLVGRQDATAVWTGNEVLVWGGYAGSNGPCASYKGYCSDGARYDPTSDKWAAIPPSPLSLRSRHSSVWTGSEMIVWAGSCDCASPSEQWIEAMDRRGALQSVVQLLDTDRPE